MSDICNADEINDSRLTAYYVLTNDIELNDVSDFDSWTTKAPQYGWTPINYFAGNFNGNGHTVSGMYIYSYDYLTENSEDESRSSSAKGLFGKVSGESTDDKTLKTSISNVKLDKSLINVIDETEDVGSLIGNADYCMISSCESSAVLIAGDSKNTKDITYGDLGGMVGSAYESRITDCTFNGDYTLDLSYNSGHFGGIVSLLTDSDMTNCTNKGTFTTKNTINDGFVYIGGIVSHIANENGQTIENCINEADLDFGTVALGGIVSRLNGKVTNCVNKGNLTGDATKGTALLYQTGGIVAFAETGTIENCTNEGNIKGMSAVSGIAGYNQGVDMIKCTNKGNADASDKAGGIVGVCDFASDSETSKITECINGGNITVTDNYAGGIAGYITKSGSFTLDELQITDCKNTGAVTATGEIEDTVASVGGIAGCTYGMDGEFTLNITNCENSGDVTAVSGHVGGILGENLYVYNAENDVAYTIKSCTNNRNVVQGDGKTEIKDTSAKGKEKADSVITDDTFYLYLSYIPSYGGIVGFFNGGTVDGCVNNGSIFIDSSFTPVLTQNNLNYVLSDVIDNDDSVEPYGNVVFAGQITGIVYYGKEVEKKSASDYVIKNCTYKNTNATMGVLFPETNETATIVK